MLCKIKGFVDERIEDAPFIGCLVVANSCHRNCKGCFNQHLKDKPTITVDTEEIIQRVKKDPINQGIIFGGLEWAQQPYELYELILLAANNGLNVMVYTGCTEDELYPVIKPAIDISCNKVDVYVKYGMYLRNRPKTTMYGVTLASDNQYIKYYSLQKELN